MSTSSLSKNHQRYTRKEIVDLAKQKGISGISRKTMEELYNELLSIGVNLSDEMRQNHSDKKKVFTFMALDKIRPITKKRLERFFQSVKSRRRIRDIPATTFPILSIPFKRPSGMLGDLTPLYIDRLFGRGNDLTMQSKEYLPTICTRFAPFDPFKARVDRAYLFNKNVFSMDSAFLDRQIDYVLQLSSEDKFRVLTYTYAGDKIVNTFLLEKWNVNAMITYDFETRFTRSYLFPLAWEMYQYIFEKKTLSTLIKSLFDKQPSPKNEQYLQTLFQSFRSHNFKFIYPLMIQLVAKFGIDMRTSFWQEMIESYIQHLTRIILDAPATPAMGLTVYRGVKESDFIDIDPKKNVFVNRPFMSTTINLCTALGTSFVNVNTHCCLFVLQVLPKCKCLFLGSLSYFQEMEFLFPPGSQLYLTRSLRKSVNAPYSTLHFAIVN